ncbi:DgyrCDS13271 [Dimorphilus gyrociliatus]|uniref:Probable cytosolic iron-sulfur protein assembly protein CIAO1 homolog n=1 Tax=Dimorphilus gyrociliatus TaxID=2664684 RepID=A0A7I8WA59_9ANNE|nr:DgyrCDS13271 [Dimorphilus gyrociliatus]
MPRLQCLQTFESLNDKIWFTCWNPSGTILASCGSDKKIKLWQRGDDDKYVCINVLEGSHTRTIRSISWSKDGKFLASASFDATVCIWVKRENWECIATLEGHENEVKSVSWSSSGNFLATCSRDKSVWVWEIDEDEAFECSSVMNSHSQDVKCVKFHPNDDIFASASYDDTIKLYKPSGDEWISFCTMEGHSSTVWCVDWSEDGNTLVSCGDDRTVKLWKEFKPSIGSNNAIWKCVCTLSGYHDRPVYSVDWCHKTDLILTACGDNAIRVFRKCQTDGVENEGGLSLEMVAKEYDAHKEDVNCAAWNPIEENILASCSDDGMLKFWKFIDDQ